MQLKVNSRFWTVSHVNTAAQCSTLNACERFIVIWCLRNVGNQTTKDTPCHTPNQDLNLHITMLLPNTIAALQYQWCYLTTQQHKMWYSYGHYLYKVTGWPTPLFLFKLLSVLLSSSPYKHSLSDNCIWMVESLNIRDPERFWRTRCNGDPLPLPSTWRDWGKTHKPSNSRCLLEIRTRHFLNVGTEDVTEN